MLWCINCQCFGWWEFCVANVPVMAFNISMKTKKLFGWKKHFLNMFNKDIKISPNSCGEKLPKTCWSAKNQFMLRCGRLLSFTSPKIDLQINHVENTPTNTSTSFPNPLYPIYPIHFRWQLIIFNIFPLFFAPIFYFTLFSKNVPSIPQSRFFKTICASAPTIH